MAERKPKLTDDQVRELGTRVENVGHTIQGIGNDLALLALPMQMGGSKHTDVKKGTQHCADALEKATEALDLIYALLNENKW